MASWRGTAAALTVALLAGACSWDWDARDPRLHAGDGAASADAADATVDGADDVPLGDAPDDHARGDGATCHVSGDCPALPNARVDCIAGGRCDMTCVAPYDDCDNSTLDGCETDLSSDPHYCGTCDTICPAGHACVGGHCQ